MTSIAYVPQPLGSGNFESGFQNPDVLSQILVLLTKQPNPALDYAVDQYLSHDGSAEEVASWLDDIATSESLQEEVRRKAEELAGRFRAECMSPDT